MDAAVSNRSVMAALYRAFETLCNGSWSAVRVACVPNGAENRFVVCIEPEWRSRVYAYLAEHSSVMIPADAGPLNLCAAEALELGAIHGAAPEEAERSPRVPTELRSPPLRQILQP
jgi:hypothetical protein